MLLLLCGALLVGTPAAVEPSVSTQSRVLGGFNSVGTDDAGVQEAAAFAAQSLDAELTEVSSAERQSAGGSNYRISFTTSDGRAYHAVVRQALDRVWSIMSIEETGDHHGDIAQEQADQAEDDDE
jgi:hypothetical protein